MGNNNQSTIQRLSQKHERDFKGFDSNHLTTINRKLVEKKYIIEEFIASGGEASVFSAKKEKTNELFAIRVQKVGDKSDKENIQKILSLQEKIKGGKYLNHFIESFYTDDGEFFIQISELRAFDLSRCFEFKTFSYEEIIEFSYQMISALHSLKNASIIHTDIKPSNILCDINKNQYELCDLTLSKQIQDNKSNTNNINRGTLKYAAPEFSISKFSFSYDIYSLGLVILELILDCPLSLSIIRDIKINKQGIIDEILKNCELKQNTEESKFKGLEDIVKQMLAHESDQRKSAEDLLHKINQLKSRKIDLSESNWNEQNVPIMSLVDIQANKISKYSSYFPSESTQKQLLKMINSMIFPLIFFIATLLIMNEQILLQQNYFKQELESTLKQQSYKQNYFDQFQEQDNFRREIKNLITSNEQAINNINNNITNLNNQMKMRKQELENVYFFIDQKNEKMNDSIQKISKNLELIDVKQKDLENQTIQSSVLIKILNQDFKEQNTAFNTTLSEFQRQQNDTNQEITQTTDKILKQLELMHIRQEESSNESYRSYLIIQNQNKTIELIQQQIEEQKKEIKLTNQNKSANHQELKNQIENLKQQLNQQEKSNNQQEEQIKSLEKNGQSLQKLLQDHSEKILEFLKPLSELMEQNKGEIEHIVNYLKISNKVLTVVMQNSFDDQQNQTERKELNRLFNILYANHEENNTNEKNTSFWSKIREYFKGFSFN